MKNIIMVVVLAVALTAACMWFFLRDNQGLRGHRRFNSSHGLKALSPAPDGLRDKARPAPATLPRAMRGRDHTPGDADRGRPLSLPARSESRAISAQYQASVFNFAPTWESNLDLDVP